MSAPKTPAPANSNEGELPPSNYWEQSDLDLFFTDKKTFSVDTVGARKYGLKANTRHEYVSQLQRDLISLGYLLSDSKYREGVYETSTHRAVLRFQRHAARPYRKPGPDAQAPRKPTITWDIQVLTKTPAPYPGTPESLSGKGPFRGPDTLYTGSVDGRCEASTAQAIRAWIDRGYKVPVGYFPLTPVQVTGATGKLRQDAATAWAEIVQLATQKGAVLEGPYGDTTRVLQKMTKAGTSRYSFHYCGRAVDINQALGGGKGQKYFIAKETDAQDTYWRIYCKTELQDGTQGVKFTKGQVKYYVFQGNKEVDIPAGYYIDLTEIIESKGTFERIKAQSQWEQNYNKTEWWHFQYKVDKQATFLDEMELIGYSEKQLREAGWNTDEMLDHPPG